MRGIFNELAAEYGFRKVAAHEVEEFRDLHGTELLKALGLSLWKLPRVVAALRTKMSKHAHGLKPYPGIPEALGQLTASGILLGVVSSNSAENVQRILGTHGSLIHHYSCGASMFGKAPKIQALARKCKVRLEQVLYVGDEIRDAEAAAKAGVAFGAVSWGQNRIETLRKMHPAEVFSSVQDLVQHLTWSSGTCQPRSTLCL
jgi:phosphoglycolate phosphatase